MSFIELDKDPVLSLIGQTEASAESAATVLNGFPSSVDGGLASAMLSFITRLAVEGSQLAADTTTGLCAVARSAVDGLLADELEIYEALNNFSEGPRE